MYVNAIANNFCYSSQVEILRSADLPEYKLGLKRIELNSDESCQILDDLDDIGEFCQGISRLQAVEKEHCR